MSQEIRKRSGVNIMYEQLAYIMRSGAPDSLDRMVAVSFGSLACDQVAMGHTGRMVSLQQGIYTTVPLDMVVAGKKRVDVTALYDSQQLPAARARHAGQADVPVLAGWRLATCGWRAAAGHRGRPRSRGHPATPIGRHWRTRRGPGRREARLVRSAERSAEPTNRATTLRLGPT